MTRRGNMGTHHQTKNMLAAAKSKMERSMVNFTYRDRKTNIWVRVKTKVTDKSKDNSQKTEMDLGELVSRIQDNRRTLRITTWKLYLRKRHRGRPMEKRTRR